MIKAFLQALVYLVIQGTTAFVAAGVYRLITGATSMPVGLLAAISALSAVIAIALFLKSRWTVVSRSYLLTRPWLVLLWTVVAALGTVVPSIWLQEHLAWLPDLSEQQMGELLLSPWGYVLVVLLVPLAEEVAFRGGMLRALLSVDGELAAGRDGRHRVTTLRAWAMIACSALLFSVCHLNPAQMPHAFLIGLLLGWLYWRTGSIVPGLVLHVMNNMTSWALFRLYPSTDITLTDVLGSQRSVGFAVVFSLMILLPALFQLRERTE